MYTRLMQLAVAALAAMTLSACDNTDSRDLLAPHAGPSKILAVGPINSGPVICTPSSPTQFCQMNLNGDVSAGEGVTCSLRLNGLAFCWGPNESGQLGDGGAETFSATPVQVAGGRVYSSISLGSGYACAIERNTGAAFCWGQNDAGQLGIGQSGGSRSIPVAVLGGHIFSSISAGVGVTCGVSAAKALCWGTGQSINSSTPISVSDLPDSYAAISVGNLTFDHGRCFVTTGGTACQGGGVQMIAQGGTADHFCFIGLAQEAKCWGYNAEGQLGNGTSGSLNPSTTPVTVSGFHSFQFIATGGETSCALSNGAAFCWGFNDPGNYILGSGSGQMFSSTPVAVTMPAGKTFTKIAVGHRHVCAIDNAGAIWCWGSVNGSGNSGVPVKITQPGIV